MGTEEHVQRLKEAFDRFLGKPEDQYEQFDKNLEDLPDSADETYFPPVPRLLWLDARQSFVFAQYVGSLLLSALAIEVSIREFLLAWFERKTGEDLSDFLEGLDFRKAIMLCRTSKCFGDHKELEDFYTELHKCCDMRTWYAHGKISKILTNDWRKVLSSEGDAEGKGFPSALAALDVKARDDALKILRLSQEMLVLIFTRSGFWYGTIGKP